MADKCNFRAINYKNMMFPIVSFEIRIRTPGEYEPYRIAGTIKPYL